ncbi:MAG TPA: hypothetical protein VHF26_17835 [Trebonia sp.]|nr:hypothetical protein [Trebonia sp.]
MRALAGLGIDHVLVTAPGPWTERSLGALAALLPEVHALDTAPAR